MNKDFMESDLTATFLLSCLTENDQPLTNEEKSAFCQKVAAGFQTHFPALGDDETPAVIAEWNEVFHWVTEHGLLATLAGYLDYNVFFSIGETLLDTGPDRKAALDVMIHHLLNMFRQNVILRKAYGDDRWETVLHDLIAAGRYTVSVLFRQRFMEYREKTLFRVMHGSDEYTYDWEQIRILVDDYAKALLSQLDMKRLEEKKIAFLMENSLDMAILDLACLTTGIVNVMIPANVVPQHLEFILEQTGAEVMLVSGDRQLAKVKQVKYKLRHLKLVVALGGNFAEEWVLPFSEALRRGESVSDEELVRIRERIRTDDIATIMYTSGTTGEPKGIVFSQMNLVYKRFCRALALPEWGEKDRFVCYLPLYHTFGRYLEMLGSVFWAAEYIFLENPSLETMLETMKRTGPTIFISIPKKWQELYEHITRNIDLMVDDEAKIREALVSATGGALRWGLSAAGYLEPDIFQFFQKSGVELMSGFGMTEATGGITMTPPGEYVPNTLGKPLPGVQVKLGEDGEMLIRGPYIMTGYYDTPDDKTFRDGWLPTGDIMTRDENGYYRIIDRKKEIYKNLRGETIAPQRIENLFRDFEFVRQVFLVGDHRLFNTVLIYPDDEASDGKLKTMTEEEKQAYFSSVIVTANKFLAPYERIVDFRLIDRHFGAEYGELTPKGTYKRRVIESHFEDVINSMYERNYTELKWESMRIHIPNWFLRETGSVKQDLKITDEGIRIPKYKRKLALKKIDPEHSLYQIGDFIYQISTTIIDFQMLLSNPYYWIGNQAIVDFAGKSIYTWYRIDRPGDQIRFSSAESREITPEILRKLGRMTKAEELSLEGLHLAVLCLRGCDPVTADQGLKYFTGVLEKETRPLYDLALEIIGRPHISCAVPVRRKVFILGLSRYKGPLFGDYFYRFLQSSPDFLDQHLATSIVTSSRGAENLDTVHHILEQEAERHRGKKSLRNTRIPCLLNLIATYGIYHPAQYKRVRQMVVEYQLVDNWKSLARQAGKVRQKLLAGFRNWLGENQPVAVDIETGEEYEWPDVVTFEADIPEEDKVSMTRVLEETSILREAIFLFSKGMIIRLYDIPQGGIWISSMGTLKDKNLYRVSVQTRYQGSHEILFIMDRLKDTEAAKVEVNWIIHISAPGPEDRSGLVDEFGGYWPAHHIWSEAFIPGESVTRILQRHTRQLDPEKENRLFYLWRYMIWTAASAHVQFWNRTGCKWELHDKSARNIIIPEHDYQTGERFISIAERIRSAGLLPLLLDLEEKFIRQGEDEYSFLKGEGIWSYVFSGVIEALGQEEGKKELLKLKSGILDKTAEPFTVMKHDLDAFLDSVEMKGYIPRALFFAIKRFHRWKRLNVEAALTAQARTLNEFYDTYQLNVLEKRYPGVRTRFFLETVFRDSSGALKSALQEVLRKQHSGEYGSKETLAVISRIQKEFTLDEAEIYFLARLSYPHLKPTDTAFFLEEAGDVPESPGVVVRLEDYDGKIFWIRQPMSPKEISKLHRLFLDNNLPVNFRSDDHFLVAISDRGYIIGGLFYNYTDRQTVYMDKIVVASRFRRKGVSEGLMNEFFNRLRDEHVEFVTTGFLRPEYFYRFGFKIERKYAGLVKDLRVAEESAPNNDI